MRSKPQTVKLKHVCYMYKACFLSCQIGVYSSTLVQYSEQTSNVLVNLNKMFTCCFTSFSPFEPSCKIASISWNNLEIKVKFQNIARSNVEIF